MISLLIIFINASDESYLKSFGVWPSGRNFTIFKNSNDLQNWEDRMGLPTCKIHNAEFELSGRSEQSVKYTYQCRHMTPFARSLVENQLFMRQLPQSKKGLELEATYESCLTETELMKQPQSNTSRYPVDLSLTKISPLSLWYAGLIQTLLRYFSYFMEK